MGRKAPVSWSNNPSIHYSITPFGRWSQSPVLPWARLAYDACLSAGSTACLHTATWSPHLELHQAKLTYRASGSLTILWGQELVSLTVPLQRDPVISCMRGRHVGWTTPQGLKKW